MWPRDRQPNASHIEHHVINVFLLSYVVTSFWKSSVRSNDVVSLVLTLTKSGDLMGILNESFDNIQRLVRFIVVSFVWPLCVAS